MQIKKLIVGILDTNCYILNIDNDYLVIDPGAEANKITSYIKGNLRGIIVTHHHFDHIGAIDKLVNKFKTKVYDINNLKEGNNKIGEFKFNLFYTPGHKSDSISLLFNDKLFTGDFIFENAIGRCDLPTGDFKQMQESIKKLLTLNENIIIYPGHGNEITLKKERQNLIKYL